MSLGAEGAARRARRRKATMAGERFKRIICVDGCSPGRCCSAASTALVPMRPSAVVAVKTGISNTRGQSAAAAISFPSYGLSRPADLLISSSTQPTAYTRFALATSSSADCIHCSRSAHSLSIFLRPLRCDSLANCSSAASSPPFSALLMISA